MPSNGLGPRRINIGLMFMSLKQARQGVMMRGCPRRLPVLYSTYDGSLVQKFHPNKGEGWGRYFGGVYNTQRVCIKASKNTAPSTADFQ